MTMRLQRQMQSSQLVFLLLRAEYKASQHHTPAIRRREEKEKAAKAAKAAANVTYELDDTSVDNIYAEVTESIDTCLKTLKFCRHIRRTNRVLWTNHNTRTVNFPTAAVMTDKALLLMRDVIERRLSTVHDYHKNELSILKLVFDNGLELKGESHKLNLSTGLTWEKYTTR